MKSLQDTQVDLSDLFAIVWRRRAVLFITSGVILLVVLVYCLAATPEYESASVIQVLNQAPDGMGSVGGPEGAATSDAQSAPITDKTEATILSSDSLALDTIEKLHLDREWPAFKPKRFTFPRLHPVPAVDPAAARDQANIKRFHEHLSVAPITGTIQHPPLKKSPGCQVAQPNMNRGVLLVH